MKINFPNVELNVAPVEAALDYVATQPAGQVTGKLGASSGNATQSRSKSSVNGLSFVDRPGRFRAGETRSIDRPAGAARPCASAFGLVTEQTGRNYASEGRRYG